ncbi:MAG TPA: disulfide oxidoreductase [Clostridiales bacterium]|jgi:hybrid cluster-associated redox disulfide protein|nr:disulfide oxidoreductase [Clostridiales bacterium]
MTISKDMYIGQILREKPESAEILFQYGMGCIGCPSSQMETLEQAAAVHGLDLDELLKSLNA